MFSEKEDMWKKLIYEQICKDAKNKVSKEGGDYNTILLNDKEQFGSKSRDYANIIKRYLAMLFPERFFLYDYHHMLCEIVHDKVNDIIKRLYESKENKQVEIDTKWEQSMKDYCNSYIDADPSALSKENLYIEGAINGSPKLMISFKTRRMCSIYGGDTVRQEDVESDLKSRYSQIERDYCDKLEELFLYIRESDEFESYDNKSDFVECMVRYIYYINGWVEYDIKEPIGKCGVMELYKDILDETGRKVIELFYKNASPTSYFNSYRNLKREHKMRSFSKMHKSIRVFLDIAENRKMYESIVGTVNRIFENRSLPLYQGEIEGFANRYLNFGIESKEILYGSSDVLTRCLENPLGLQNLNIQKCFMKILDLLEEIDNELDKEAESSEEETDVLSLGEKILNG